MEFYNDNKHWRFEASEPDEFEELIAWLHGNHVGTYELQIRSLTPKAGGGKFGYITFGNMQDAMAFKLRWS